MVTKPKRLLLIVFFNALLILAGIAILELLFGNWTHPDRLNRLNIIRDRKITYEIGHLYPSSEKTITYSRDRFGLRGRFHSPSDIVILTVGGSTTDQRYIADGKTWQDKLQQAFEAAGEHVVVANAGVDGQSTVGHIRDFELWFPHIPGLRPRYVLFYIGINDFYVSKGYGFDRLTIGDGGGSLLQYIRERSAIYYLARTLYGIYLAKVKYRITHRHIRFGRLQWTAQAMQRSYGPRLDTRLRQYGDRLDILVKKTRAFGAVPIFVTQPARKYRLKNGRIEGVAETVKYCGMRINGVDFYRIMRMFDHVTCAKACEHHIVCVDLAREMLPALQDDDFYDFVHMTPKGARKVGRYLFNALKTYVTAGVRP